MFDLHESSPKDIKNLKMVNLNIVIYSTHFMYKVILS